MLNWWVACRFGCGFFLGLVSDGGLLGVGLVSGGGEWRKAFFWDLLFVVNGDSEYFFVVVSVVVVAWWVAVPIWVYSFFFGGLWVWISDRWFGVCGCGLAVRLVVWFGFLVDFVGLVVGTSNGGRGVGYNREIGEKREK